MQIENAPRCRPRRRGSARRTSRARARPPSTALRPGFRGRPGNCCSSSGTRKPRSTISSPATVIHSRTARPTDSSFNPKCRNGHSRVRHVYCTRDSLRAGAARRAARATAGANAVRRSRSRARSARRRRSTPCPISSDTTIATASFSSVSPMAARCREPSSLLSFGLIVSGRKQAAAATRSSCTITAPSCSGDDGWKMLRIRSYVSTASSAIPAFDVVTQTHLPFDGDDRANSMCRQHARGDDQLFDRFFRRLFLREVPEKRGAAQVRQRAPDVGLKQHDDREDDVAEEVADQPVECIEPAPPRAVEHAHQERGPDGHLHGARPPDELQDLVNENRHHEDVGDVPPADGRTTKERGEPRHHNWPGAARRFRIASAARTTCTIWATACTRTMCAPASTAACHGRGGRPVAPGRVGTAGGFPQKRLARRTDQHGPVRAPRDLGQPRQHTITMRRPFGKPEAGIDQHPFQRHAGGRRPATCSTSARRLTSPIRS